MNGHFSACGIRRSIICAGKTGALDSIIVVGGINNSWDSVISSVEILDGNLNEWRQGPELPKPLYGAAMVRHPDGGVVFIGGSNHRIYSDAFFYLPHAGPGAEWRKLPQTLKHPR